MGQEIKKPQKSAENRKNPEILPRTLTLGIFENWDKIFCTDFSRKTQKINKFFTKNKNKKYIFFQIKNGTRNKNPQKTGNPKKSSQKIFHFLKDFHSLTPAAVLFPLEQSLILLGRIHALGHLSNNKEQVHFHSQSTTKY